jgi:hypothetical protein
MRVIFELTLAAIHIGATSTLPTKHHSWLRRQTETYHFTTIKPYPPD